MLATPREDRLVHEQIVIVKVNATQGKTGRASLRRARASMTKALLRATSGKHSVQPVAISVSTMVWTKLPAAEVPACATKSTSTKPGGGSVQSPNVRTGTARRTAELKPARRLRPPRAATC